MQNGMPKSVNIVNKNEKMKAKFFYVIGWR